MRMSLMRLQNALILYYSKTRQYCDPLIASWATQADLNSTQSCSDCWLGAQQLQMADPLGYD
jgi:hypothetical protein